MPVSFVMSAMATAARPSIARTFDMPPSCARWTNRATRARHRPLRGRHHKMCTGMDEMAVILASFGG
jgi:hypothetical protein